MARVVAVVVTYNRRDLLADTLAALDAQSRRPDAVVLIDNASTDGTPGRLAELGWLKDPTHTCHRLPRNTGGAGGFAAGVDRAIAAGADWVWLMDDDGYPDADALERLLEVADGTGLRVLNPLVVDRDDPARLAFGLAGGVRTVADARARADARGLVPGDANPFNGTLIAADVVARVGGIKREMFIWGDETEYFLRLQAHGIDYATACAALFRHPASRTSYRTALRGRVTVIAKPERLEMNYFRNVGYIDRAYGRRVRIPFLVKHVLFYASEGRPARAWTFLRYYFDGWFDRYRLPALR